MKRVSSILVVVVLFIAIFAVPVSAQTQTTVDYLEDGSYFVTEIKQTPVAPRSGKSGSKSVTYYNLFNTAQWKLTVNGSFTYNGSSSSCTSATSSVTIYNSNCSLVTKSANRSGNQAIGKTTVKNGLSSKSKTVTLTCSKNGTLS